MAVRFSVSRNEASTALLLAPAMLSFRAFTRFISTLTGPGIVTPYSALRRARWAAYALATSAFVGVHPVLMSLSTERDVLLGISDHGI
jgi:hypothetical protein